jgi:hypothetical protein
MAVSLLRRKRYGEYSPSPLSSPAEGRGGTSGSSWADKRGADRGPLVYCTPSQSALPFFIASSSFSLKSMKDSKYFSSWFLMLESF